MKGVYTMDTLPIFLNLKKKKILVVGGGNAAFIKIKTLLKIIGQEKYKATYFNHWSDKFITSEFYTPPMDLPIKKLPEDNTTDNILYAPFDIEMIAPSSQKSIISCHNSVSLFSKEHVSSSFLNSSFSNENKISSIKSMNIFGICSVVHNIG